MSSSRRLQSSSRRLHPSPRLSTRPAIRQFQPIPQSFELYKLMNTKGNLLLSGASSCCHCESDSGPLLMGQAKLSRTWLGGVAWIWTRPSSSLAPIHRPRREHWRFYYHFRGGGLIQPPDWLVSEHVKSGKIDRILRKAFVSFST